MHKNIFLFLTGLASGILFLKGDQPMLVIFSFFLITLSFAKQFQRISKKINTSFFTKVFVLVTIVGLITELLAFWNNIHLSSEEIMQLNRLYSPYLYADLLIGLGYYIPMAFFWCFLLKKMTFSIKEIFIVMGVFGIFFEANGLILMSLNPVAWLYAFLVHGSYLSIIFIILKEEAIVRGRWNVSRWKKYSIAFLVSVATVIPFAIWKLLLSLFVNF